MRRALVVIGTVLALAGCKHDDKLNVGFTPRPEPPGGLRPGMTHDEAHTALPGLTTVDPAEAKINSRAMLIATFRNNKLAEAVALFAPNLAKQEAVDTFTALWGKPEPIHSPTNPLAELEWKSLDTGWRVDLECPPSGATAICSGLRFLTYRPLTAAFFGKACAPPAALAKLPLGTPLADAQQVIPELAPQPIGGGKSIAHVDGGADGAIGNVFFDDKNLVYALSIDLPLAKDAEQLLATAWGTGKTATDEHGAQVTTWTDAATGWRCELAHLAVHEGTVVVDAAELRFARATP